MAVRNVENRDVIPNTAVSELIAVVNSLSAKLAALTAKMDADFADVTSASTDYVASIPDADTIALNSGTTPT